MQTYRSRISASSILFNLNCNIYVSSLSLLICCISSGRNRTKYYYLSPVGFVLPDTVWSVCRRKSNCFICSVSFNTFSQLCFIQRFVFSNTFSPIQYLFCSSLSLIVYRKTYSVWSALANNSFCRICFIYPALV